MPLKPIDSKPFKFPVINGGEGDLGNAKFDSKKDRGSAQGCDVRGSCYARAEGFAHGSHSISTASDTAIKVLNAGDTESSYLQNQVTTADGLRTIALTHCQRVWLTRGLHAGKILRRVVRRMLSVKRGN